MAVSNIFIAKAYLVSSYIKCFPLQIKNGERTVNILFAHSHSCTRSNFHNVLHPDILEALALLQNCIKLPHIFFTYHEDGVEKFQHALLQRSPITLFEQSIFSTSRSCCILEPRYNEVEGQAEITLLCRLLPFTAV